MIKNKNNLPTTRNFLLERDLFGMKIPMRTKDGCYDLNEMLSEYNKHNPNNQKRLIRFFESEDTQTYINNLTKIRFAELSGNMQLLDNQECASEHVPVNQLVTDSTKNFKVSVKIDKTEKIILQKTKGKTQSNGKKDKDTVFADSFYNASQLLRDYNEHYPNERKEMYDFFRTKNTQNYIGSVLNDNDSFPNIFGKIDNEKDTLFYVKKGRKSNVGRSFDTYYFAPMLFSKFGTWLSSDLERDIHKVLWNNILEYRKEVTELMPEFKNSIKDFKTDGSLYVKVNSMLQCAVFGKYQPKQKPLDKANENELFRYKQLQNEIITLVKFNLIKDYEDLKTHIQSYYK